MEISMENWDLYRFTSRPELFELNPPYQRTPVWSVRQQQLLIDSILRGYPIPPIFLKWRTRTDSSEKPWYDVVDGQQRIRALQSFHANEFAIEDFSDEFESDHYQDTKGRIYSSLDPIYSMRIDASSFSVYLLKAETSDEETRHLFIRLQEGSSLNPPERRNAMLGEMREFIYNLAEGHPLFTKHIEYNSNRYAHHDLAAIVTKYELNGGLPDVKSKTLRQMYKAEKNWNANGKDAAKIKRVLNYLDKCASLPQAYKIKLKWPFLDAYALVSRLMDLGYVIDNLHQNTADFIEYIESLRLRYTSVESKRELAIRTDLEGSLLFKYINAFDKEGAIHKNIKDRSETYMRLFLHHNRNIPTKDPKRLFTADERFLLWHDAGKKCKHCGEVTELEEIEADHILEHSLGGTTALDNGQPLCKPCHINKTREKIGLKSAK